MLIVKKNGFLAYSIQRVKKRVMGLKNCTDLNSLPLRNSFNGLLWNKIWDMPATVKLFAHSFWLIMNHIVREIQNLIDTNNVIKSNDHYWLSLCRAEIFKRFHCRKSFLEYFESQYRGSICLIVVENRVREKGKLIVELIFRLNQTKI